MFPSCGCSQSSLMVGIGPMFRRSMCVASVSSRWNFGSFGDRRADQRGADRFEHLLLRAFDHGGEREHVFLLGDGRGRRLAVDDRRPQVGAAFHFDQPRAVLRGHVL